MKLILSKLVKKLFSFIGYKISKINNYDKSIMPVELSESDQNIIRYVFDNNLSMTSLERLSSTALACKYVVQNNIPGDFVECGVWRGGHAIIAAHFFKKYSSSRNIWLFDTFNGMTKPTNTDFELSSGNQAINEFNKNNFASGNKWCYASLEDVKENFKKLNLLSDKIKFIQGDILETLDFDQNIPNSISLLRLDTDWYQSTAKELKILYPNLSKNGVLCIDDYGHWSGSKRATDDFFSSGEYILPFFQAIDYSARCCIKT